MIPALRSAAVVPYHVTSLMFPTLSHAMLSSSVALAPPLAMYPVPLCAPLVGHETITFVTTLDGVRVAVAL